MQKRNRISVLRQLTLLGLTVTGVFFSACNTTGERGTQGQDQRPADPVHLAKRDLPAIKSIIAENAVNLDSLSAECRAVIRSPLIRQPPYMVEMSGDLVLMKRKRVFLELYGGGKTYVKLVGDGARYRIDMPVFGDLSYGGTYGDPIRPRPDRLHFMPDDLADALDLNDLFAGKTQLLRSLPEVWHVDSLLLTGGPGPLLRAVNSIVIDRAVEQMSRMDKFNEDCSLRVRIWFQEQRLVEGPKGRRAVVPTQMIFWYPMENTTIVMSLSGIKINEPFDAARFRP